MGTQGYVEDPGLGLYFVRARYYDPVAGRWLSEDPLGYRAGDANLYRYCFNNPVNHTDPSGRAVLVPQDETLVHLPGGGGRRQDPILLLSRSANPSWT